MLICGVLDSKNESEVRHAGDAMVVFDPSRVVPLFEARLQQARVLLETPPPPPPLPTQPPWRQPQQMRPHQVQSAAPQRPERKRPVIPLAGAAAFLARRAARKRQGATGVR